LCRESGTVQREDHPWEEEALAKAPRDRRYSFVGCGRELNGVVEMD